MNVVGWLDPEEQHVWRTYLAVTSKLDERLDRALRKESGITLVEYGLLVHLSEAPERRLRMSLLADAVLVSKSRLSHQVARLERDGYVRRETCGEDRRGSWAVLTDKGLEAVRSAAPGHVSDVRRYFFDHLTPDDLKELRDTLDRLNRGLDD
ncbi:MarR family transcriptional regulator [Spiractinospora alimapuensis]|uniref:MarR family winged helix-turn-helix transcriptional regulator n=1 Tax=Spiractinospora alimapuensis TaxID=2820884 RepID=UPI001F3B2592|nr:MarR family transcriptional regulator [Spiractinospora alimapuensis]QVQ53154.1 MarR family transcriptional regulator [Spiractinospora alimapuensis]